MAPGGEAMHARSAALDAPGPGNGSMNSKQLCATNNAKSHELMNNMGLTNAISFFPVQAVSFYR